MVLNPAGLAFGVWRLAYGPTDEVMTVIISPVWVLYNMTILGGAVAVAVEAKQVRQAHRVEIAMPAAIARRRPSVSLHAARYPTAAWALRCGWKTR